jgi:hypothetical protein
LDDVATSQENSDIVKFAAMMTPVLLSRDIELRGSVYPLTILLKEFLKEYIVGNPERKPFIFKGGEGGTFVAPNFDQLESILYRQGFKNQLMLWVVTAKSFVCEVTAFTVVGLNSFTAMKANTS